YPELTRQRQEIRSWTEAEERRFLETIEGGLERLTELIDAGFETIPGPDAFRLYDTYGFPVDLTQLIAGERGVAVDLEGFEQALAGQRERSRSARVVSGQGSVVREASGRVRKPKWHVLRRGKQRFVGYETTEA